MSLIPEKLDEFRSHKLLVLPSLLRRYEHFHPLAKPYKDLKFYNEFIYLRKDIVNLHTPEQWRRLGRKVFKGKKPIKEVKGSYNDKTRKARLFASWQTEVFMNKLNDDGSLPQNDFGNIEIFKPSDVPKGTTYLDAYMVKRICKKLEIEYRDALTGFTLNPNGMSYPIIKGVIVHTENISKIIEESKQKEIDRDIRQEKENKRLAKETWKKLIRKVPSQYFNYIGVGQKIRVKSL
jgi:xeroderma pigmentosum group C-complementing protein